MNLAVETVAADDVLAHDAVLAIYAEAIEPAEQKPVETVRQLFTDPRYVLLGARRELRLIGFALIFLSTVGGFWLLEYMAVASDERSGGVGGRLLSAAMALGTGRAGMVPGLLEVDDGSVGPQAQRRLEFYRRAGCRRIAGLSYVLPLNHAGVPPPMMLLVTSQYRLEQVRLDEVRGWLSTIYSQVYGREAQDPRIDLMLMGLPDLIELALLEN